MLIYREWGEKTSRINLRPGSEKTFSGLLSQCFISSCIALAIDRPDWSIVSRRDLMRYCLNAKERVKGVAFAVSPRIYCEL